MNAIIIHSTQPLFENARLSVEAAATRWNCDLKVFDFPFEPHPSFARLALPSLLTAYDRVLVLDPDIVLSGDYPNPFQHVPADVVAMAPEVQSDKPYPWRAALDLWSHKLGHNVNVSRHLNGGLCLYSPSLHGPHIERMHKWWVDKGRFSTTPIYEQPFWYEIGEQGGLPIRRISPELNKHTWEVPTSWPSTFGSHLRVRKPCNIKRLSDWAKPSLLNARLSIRLADKGWVAKACFHEDILVVGDGRGYEVYAAASVTAGKVTWLADFGDRTETAKKLRGIMHLASKLTAISKPEPEWEGFIKGSKATLVLR
jgi:hypothetical protein